LPLIAPADTMQLVPRPSAIANRSEPFHLGSEGEAFMPFVFAVVGKELFGVGHHLAAGAVWRPATSWHPIVDGALSLLRRLLLAEASVAHCLLIAS